MLYGSNIFVLVKIPVRLHTKEIPQLRQAASVINVLTCHLHALYLYLLTLYLYLFSIYVYVLCIIYVRQEAHNDHTVK